MVALQVGRRHEIVMNVAEKVKNSVRKAAKCFARNSPILSLFPPKLLDVGTG
jgi:hypothetical protein